MEPEPADARLAPLPRQSWLLSILSVPETQRVQCQETGCGRPIHAAVYIADDTGQLLILGSG